MSYPKNLKDFKEWAKKMEDGAQVDRPRYKSTSSRKPRVFKKARKRWKKRKQED